MLDLPWPPKSLSPNSRVDRRRATDERQEYKTFCFWAAKKAGIEPSLGLSITFRPPDNRRRDLDNMLASIKSGLDGVAMAMGRDDYRWEEIYLRRGQPVKHGSVLVEARRG